MSKEKIKYVKLQSHNPNQQHPSYACFTINTDDEQFWLNDVGFIPYNNIVTITYSSKGELYSIESSNYSTNSIMEGNHIVTEISREQFVHEYATAIAQLNAKAGIIDLEIKLK